MTFMTQSLAILVLACLIVVPIESQSVTFTDASLSETIAGPGVERRQTQRDVRQDRREGHQDRREDRRDAHQDHREERRDVRHDARPRR